jgi:hypothetical protein
LAATSQPIVTAGADDALADRENGSKEFKR